MPTYQYACTACGEQHEAVQSFTDAPLSDCPACGGRLRKVFSAVGVVFKGSGFYKTDSRSGGGKGSSDKGADTGADKGSGDGGKTDVPKTDGGAAKPAAAATGSSSSGTASTSPAAKSA